MIRNLAWIFSLVLLGSCSLAKNLGEQENQTYKFATYNTSLFQKQKGALINKLANHKDEQAVQLAKIIRKVRPDFLLLQEFDFDEAGKGLRLFKENFLQNPGLGTDTLHYRYGMMIPSNTGLSSGTDLDQNGKISNPGDAFGFGFFEGQYGFAVLSKFPLDTFNMRTFQEFLWKEMPGAVLPLREDGNSYYTAGILELLRLSSKNHVDLPVLLPGGKIIHALLSHPTPPVFDGPEDRNGRRNHDEIRFWKDYIENASYLVDDEGKRGGLEEGAHFVLLGDMNADPVDGDSYKHAIRQVLELKKINREAASGSKIPKSEGGKSANQKKNDKGDPAFDTSFFGLRVDYVLPDGGLEVKGSGVVWPADKKNRFDISKGKPSDHLMVWLEFSF